MTSEEKTKFNKYWKVVFKYLFLIYFVVITARLILILVTDNAESMTLYSIVLGYSIGLLGSFALSILIAYRGVNSER